MANVAFRLWILQRMYIEVSADLSIKNVRKFWVIVSGLISCCITRNIWINYNQTDTRRSVYL